MSTALLERRPIRFQVESESSQADQESGPEKTEALTPLCLAMEQLGIQPFTRESVTAYMDSAVRNARRLDEKLYDALGPPIVIAAILALFGIFGMGVTACFTDPPIWFVVSCKYGGLPSIILGIAFAVYYSKTMQTDASWLPRVIDVNDQSLSVSVAQIMKVLREKCADVQFEVRELWVRHIPRDFHLENPSSMKRFPVHTDLLLVALDEGDSRYHYRSYCIEVWNQGQQPQAQKP